MRKLVSFAPYVVLVLIASLVALSQSLIYLADAPTGRYRYLTGDPKIVLGGDELHLQLLTPAKRIALVFDNDLLASPIPIFQGDVNYKVHWNFENPKYVGLEMVAATSQEGTEGSRSPKALQHFHLQMGSSFAFGDIRQRGLAFIVLDDNHITSQLLYLTQIDRARSTLQVYFPFAMQNVSGELARSLGPVLMWLLMFALVLLLVAQWIIVFLRFKWIRDSAYGKQLSEHVLITRLESIADTSAIPLGLFGTIVGIWMALEQPSVHFSSFAHVVQVLRSAVLTTVLGFAVKIGVVASELLGSESRSSRERS